MTAHFIDPWRPVCERCPLPDCIRLEGEYQPLAWGGTRSRGCPITEARLNDWGPAEAVANAEVLELLEPVEWGDW